MNEQQIRARLGGALVVAGALGLLAAAACYAVMDFTTAPQSDHVSLADALAQALRAGPVTDAASIIELIADLLLLVGALLLTQLDWICAAQRTQWIAVAIGVAIFVFADGFSGYLLGHLAALPLPDTASFSVARAWLYMCLALGTAAIGIGFCAGFVQSRHWPWWARCAGLVLALYYLLLPLLAESGALNLPGTSTVLTLATAGLVGYVGWRTARSA